MEASGGKQGSASAGGERRSSRKPSLSSARARGAEACHVVGANVCATEGAYPGLLKYVAEPVPLLADSPLRLAEYLSGLLKRALAKFARKEAEAVTECRVFTEEGPLLIEIWLASSFQSLFSRNPLA